MNTYYTNELYPLQDNVLKVIDTINTPFYLTGGTALSRCYFQHRYSVEKKLKVDLVNDVGSHIGGFVKHTLFSRIDNIHNILSNKITALVSRDEPKDVVDIWAIAKNEKINWKQIFMDASSKATGIFPPMVAERLESFPIEMTDTLKWIDGQKPSQDTLKKDIATIVVDILQIDTDFKKLKE